MQNTFKKILIGIFSLTLPAVLGVYYYDKSLIKEPIFYLIFWAIANYLFVITIFEKTNDFKKILLLEDLKIRTSYYYINLFIYVGFYVFINIYFTVSLFYNQNTILNKFISPIVPIILLMIFFINLFTGLLPNPNSKEKSIVYSVKNKNPIRCGREMFGTLVGTFKEGIILGDLPIKYENISSIFKSKDGTLVIKGKSKNQFIINIHADKTKEKTINLIKNAVEKDLLTKDKVKFNI